VTKIIESLRGDLAVLHKAGVIGKVALCEFDTICPPPTKEFSAAGIKRRGDGFSSLAKGTSDGTPELDQRS
jgi:putative transcriptional regulator